jgi:hypothetical protein
MINKMHDHQPIEMSSTAGTTLQNTKWQNCIDACMYCAECWKRQHHSPSFP